MNFYSISIDPGRRKKFTWAFPTYGFPVDKISCKVCGRTWNSFTGISEENRSFPITFTNDYFADFLSCEAYDLVSQRVKDCLETYKINTPKFTEMPVIPKKQLSVEQLKRFRDRGFSVNRFHDEKPVYYLLSAEVGAKLHPDTGVYFINSGTDVCIHCGYGVGYKRRSYLAPEYIQLDSWNGNDIFKVKESDQLFCTERFKNLCETTKFTGVCFDEIIAK